ncbi:MAG: type 4a pilus biogenesis protein PilO [Deltaproteobacteria bacterium]|nr:type 4a pilus biogenesis protein PilO [Deltaproteobacteria bacterium]
MAVDIKSYLKIDVIMKLQTSKKLLILFGINIALCFLAYQFIFSKMTEKIFDLNIDLETAMVKLESDKKIAADIPKWTKKKRELEIDLDRALEQLPNDKEIAKLLKSIHDVGEDSGLKIESFITAGVAKKGFYAEVPVNMSVEGSYESIFVFCDKISKLERIVNISNLMISFPGKAASINPKLKASFVVTTFQFVSS